MVCQVFLKIGVNFNLIHLFVRITFFARQQIKIAKIKIKIQRFMIGRLLFCRVPGSHVFYSVYSDVVC